MKTDAYLRQFLLFLVICYGLFTETQAQSLDVTGGYWVIESNIRQPNYTIVKMYSNQHELLYEERLEGKCLNVKNRRHVRMLNAGLTNVLKNTVFAKKGVQQGNLLKMIAKL